MTMVLNGATGITFPDTSVQAKSAQGPCFSAYQSVAQSLTSNTGVKLQFQTKEFDTTNAFDNVTNNRFQPLVAGYYQVGGGVQITQTATSMYICVYKNGVPYKLIFYVGTIGGYGSALVPLNGTTDYLELFVIQSAATQNSLIGVENTYFQACLMRAA
jgi:hypothetical protein